MTSEEQEIFTLILGIVNSPILSEEEKDLLLSELKAGEPYSEELFFALTQFIITTVAYVDAQEIELTEKALQLRAEIKELKTKLQGDPEKNRKAVQQIINLTNNFLAELDKQEADFEKEVEKIIHEKGEEADIQSIRSLLQKKKPEDS